MLSATTKMEMRAQFADRMNQLIGSEFYLFYFEGENWKGIQRDFMAGRLIIVRRTMDGDKLVAVEIET